MVTIIAEKTLRREGNGGRNRVMIVAGILLSVAVVLAVGRAALVAPRDNAGVSQANTPRIAEPADIKSRNVETIIVGSDGQKVIQNSYDGSMVNLDGSVYIPMPTVETAALVASPKGVIGNRMQDWVFDEGSQQWMPIEIQGATITMPTVEIAAVVAPQANAPRIPESALGSPQYYQDWVFDGGSQQWMPIEIQGATITMPTVEIAAVVAPQANAPRIATAGVSTQYPAILMVEFSANGEWVMAWLNGQQVIQNVHDGGLLNLDGSLYIFTR